MRCTEVDVEEVNFTRELVTERPLQNLRDWTNSDFEVPSNALRPFGDVMACKVGTVHRHPEVGLRASGHISRTNSNSRSPQPNSQLKGFKIIRFKGKKEVRVLCSAVSATATSGKTQQESALFLYRSFEQENRIQIYWMQLLPSSCMPTESLKKKETL